MVEGIESALTTDMQDLLRLFGKDEVRYLVVGAHAVNTYTEARMTKDLDLWVSPDVANAKKTFEALKKFGAPLDQAKESDFTDENTFFVIGVKPNRIDILKKIPGLTFDEAWQKRNEIVLDQIKVPVLSAEDTLRAKLAAGRPQDILDARKLQTYLSRLKK